jgi:hypothetical protein
VLHATRSTTATLFRVALTSVAVAAKKVLGASSRNSLSPHTYLLVSTCYSLVQRCSWTQERWQVEVSSVRRPSAAVVTSREGHRSRMLEVNFKQYPS